MHSQWLIPWNHVQTLASLVLRSPDRQSAIAMKSITYRLRNLARQLQLRKARGREGIWGSAQRSRWKFWALLRCQKMNARTNQFWRFPFVLEKRNRDPQA